MLLCEDIFGVDIFLGEVSLRSWDNYDICGGLVVDGEDGEDDNVEGDEDDHDDGEWRRRRRNLIHIEEDKEAGIN